VEIVFIIGMNVPTYPPVKIMLIVKEKITIQLIQFSGLQYKIVKVHASGAVRYTWQALMV
jgi:hypothetical protein